MNTVVIGGAGFLGSHLVDRLLAEGVGVDVIDDLSTGSLGNLGPARAAGGELKFHHVDITAPEASSLLAMRHPDVLYHLAAVPRRPASVHDLARAYEGTLCVLEAARLHGIARVVVALPATVLYGRPAAKDLPVKERPLEPRGVRGVIARSVVDLLEVYREQHAVEFAALAIASVYGPRQRPDAGVVAAFVHARESGAAPTLVGDGRQTRDFLFVDDAVDAFVRAAERGGGLLMNIGTGVETTVRELYTRMATLAGVRDEPAWAAARTGELVRSALDPGRAAIQLGWKPWTTVDEGLALTLDWFRAQTGR